MLAIFFKIFREEFLFIVLFIVDVFATAAVKGEGEHVSNDEEKEDNAEDDDDDDDDVEDDNDDDYADNAAARQ